VKRPSYVKVSFAGALLASGSGRLTRTVKSWVFRENCTSRPLPSTTFETVSALFSSKTGVVTLSSSGAKRTSAVAVSDCVRGLISARIR